MGNTGGLGSMEGTKLSGDGGNLRSGSGVFISVIP
jgi:hypothetical protein